MSSSSHVVNLAEFIDCPFAIAKAYHQVINVKILHDVRDEVDSGFLKHLLLSAPCRTLNLFHMSIKLIQFCEFLHRAGVKSYMLHLVRVILARSFVKEKQIYLIHQIFNKFCSVYVHDETKRDALHAESIHASLILLLKRCCDYLFFWVLHFDSFTSMLNDHMDHWHSFVHSNNWYTAKLKVIAGLIESMNNRNGVKYELSKILVDEHFAEPPDLKGTNFINEPLLDSKVVYLQVIESIVEFSTHTSMLDEETEHAFTKLMHAFESMFFLSTSPLVYDTLVCMKQKGRKCLCKVQLKAGKVFFHGIRRDHTMDFKVNDVRSIVIPLLVQSNDSSVESVKNKIEEFFDEDMRELLDINQDEAMVQLEDDVKFAYSLLPLEIEIAKGRRKRLLFFTSLYDRYKMHEKLTEYWRQHSACVCSLIYKSIVIFIIARNSNRKTKKTSEFQTTAVRETSLSNFQESTLPKNFAYRFVLRQLMGSTTGETSFYVSIEAKLCNSFIEYAKTRMLKFQDQVCNEIVYPIRDVDFRLVYSLRFVLYLCEQSKCSPIACSELNTDYVNLINTIYIKFYGNINLKLQKTDFKNIAVVV